MSDQNHKLAFVFPGQGSQSIGMLTELAEIYPEVKQVFSNASEVLGKDLWSLVINGPAEELNQTYNTQPAMLAAGVAVWESWCKQTTVRPGWMAGHSLGEYTALVCSGALAFADAIALVSERGRLMQEAVPAGVGAMAAILGLDDSKVVKVCVDAAENEVVAPVNFNAPGQVVIAGNTSAVERAMTAAKNVGARRAIKLPISVPSHCSLMKPAAEKLDDQLKKIQFSQPNQRLVQNVDVKIHAEPAQIRIALKEQLYKPVHWVESINFMHEQKVSCFVECGPGKVLMGLNKRIVKAAEHLTIFDPDTLEKAMEQLG